jgi:uncharacterized protein (DUF2126 family)
VSRAPETAEERGLLEEVRAHDAALRARSVELWIGAEPTFTVRESQDPEWLVQAEGGGKLEKGIALLQAIVGELAVPARFVRAQGRLFPGENQARFCLAAEWMRGATGEPTSPVSALLDGPLESAPQPDPQRAWLTVTPDPGVVEVNLPPSPDLEGFLFLTEATFRAAGAVACRPSAIASTARRPTRAAEDRSPWAAPHPRPAPSSSSPGCFRPCCASCRSTRHSPTRSRASA